MSQTSAAITAFQYELVPLLDWIVHNCSCLTVSTVHALELEESSQTALNQRDRTCCKSLWLWHRHAGKIDWFFRLAMPPTIGVFWLHMMFAAGYTYSYEYLAAYVALFALICVLLGWVHMQPLCIFCCSGCLECVSCCVRCCSCKRTG